MVCRFHTSLLKSQILVDPDTFMGEVAYLIETVTLMICTSMLNRTIPSAQMYTSPSVLLSQIQDK